MLLRAERHDLLTKTTMVTGCGSVVDGGGGVGVVVGADDDDV